MQQILRSPRQDLQVRSIYSLAQFAPIGLLVESRHQYCPSAAQPRIDKGVLHSTLQKLFATFVRAQRLRRAEPININGPTIPVYVRRLLWPSCFVVRKKTRSSPTEWIGFEIKSLWAEGGISLVRRFGRTALTPQRSRRKVMDCVVL